MVRTTLCALVLSSALSVQAKEHTNPFILEQQTASEQAFRESWIERPPYTIEGVDEKYYVVLVDRKKRRTPVWMTSLDTFLIANKVPKTQRRELADTFFQEHYNEIIKRRWKQATESPVWQEILGATSHFEPLRRDFYRTIAVLESTGGSDPKPTKGCIGIYQIAASVLEHMKKGDNKNPGHEDLLHVKHTDLQGTKNITLQTKVFDYYIRWIEKELGVTLEEDPDRVAVAYNAGVRMFDDYRGQDFDTIEEKVCNPEHIHKIGVRFKVKAYLKPGYPHKKAIIMRAYAEMRRRLAPVASAIEFVREQERLALLKEQEEALRVQAKFNALYSAGLRQYIGRSD